MKQKGSPGKGFTLLELIVVIIIIGILGTMGFTQYTKVIEKGRIAEAKEILGQIRSAQQSYKLQYGGYADALGDLFIDAPSSCAATHYFSYGTSSNVGTADRCVAGGNSPNVSGTYQVNVNYDTGTWGGDAGYY